jgi:hypothetical protein
MKLAEYIIALLEEFEGGAADIDALVPYNNGEGYTVVRAVKIEALPGDGSIRVLFEKGGADFAEFDIGIREFLCGLLQVKLNEADIYDDLSRGQDMH